MTSSELRKKFLNFFKENGHAIIPSASLIPEHDPTVLFTTAGMHPLVPFLLGEKHPAGRRLANVQACIRTGDIEDVGDEVHHTFFEMLGNWSLGDYFKKEAIEMSWEFLTSKKWLNLGKEKIAISIFEGDPSASSGQVIPKDEESKKIWLSLGIPNGRIKALGKKDNWWGPAGQTGPCGPDTEMFYWVGKENSPKEFNPEDKKWMEVWNDVFMEYYKKENGEYEPLKQKNVDTGMGLERMLSALNSLDDDYKTDVFFPIIKKIEELSGKKYEENKKEFRIISDHIKAATFIIGDKNGVEPSNLDRGYVARRLIRRVLGYSRKLNLPEYFLSPLIKETVAIYKDNYPEIKLKENDIVTIVQKEEEKFGGILIKGIKNTASVVTQENFGGGEAYNWYSTSGVPFDIIKEIAREKGVKISESFELNFEKARIKHQELSRTASAGMFKGGLADAGGQVIKYHTATHLLIAALRQVLGKHVFQKGSNITAERLRFDFSHPQKMTEEEIEKVEDLVNQKIKEDLSVVCEEIMLDEAKRRGAMGVFEQKYGEKVKVYAVKDSSGKIFSQEICGGPHVNRTGVLGQFKIQKEESSSAGTRRIRANLQ